MEGENEGGWSMEVEIERGVVYDSRIFRVGRSISKVLKS